MNNTKNTGMNTMRKNLLCALLTLSTATVLYSCKKDDPQPMEPTAAVSVFNAVPDAAPLDFYIDDKKVNAEGLAFGNKLNYVEAFLGKKVVKVTTANAGATLINKQIDLAQSAYYSLFLINQAQTADALMVKDTFLNKNTEKAQVRFINLSPGAPSYNLEIQGDTTTFNDKAFKAATSFKYVTDKAKVTLLLKDKATGQVLATLADVELKKGFVYTIWSKGLAVTTVDAQKISLKVSAH
ncbi:DUF4397 domain-containing protein [Pedobacter psychrodurus]|uniref:DUF4397 domain-containing protein n=1 Tax=Pedobacter psychrodurus TaxID=2530456 RepID=A0A4R0Q104_9SPHI|nr:DUF4397 domain-containing protein [Pedobacter psychrodurus]TCD28656.1 DUF4397 domain-containing protein [Pedobacter psychrodurus]